MLVFSLEKHGPVLFWEFLEFCFNQCHFGVVGVLLLSYMYLHFLSDTKRVKALISRMRAFYPTCIYTLFQTQNGWKLWYRGCERFILHVSTLSFRHKTCESFDIEDASVLSYMYLHSLSDTKRVKALISRMRAFSYMYLHFLSDTKRVKALISRMRAFYPTCIYTLFQTQNGWKLWYRGCERFILHVSTLSFRHKTGESFDIENASVLSYMYLHSLSDTKRVKALISRMRAFYPTCIYTFFQTQNVWKLWYRGCERFILHVSTLSFRHKTGESFDIEDASVLSYMYLHSLSDTKRVKALISRMRAFYPTCIYTLFQTQNGWKLWYRGCERFPVTAYAIRE